MAFLHKYFCDPIFAPKVKFVSRRLNPDENLLLIEKLIPAIHSDHSNGRRPGLPDGYIFKPKIQIWVIFGGSWNESVDLLCCHLEYFASLWYILWQFGTFGYIFTRFGMFYQEKSGNPGDDDWQIAGL
jgi:hypothetical protein